MATEKRPAKGNNAVAKLPPQSANELPVSRPPQLPQLPRISQNRGLAYDAGATAEKWGAYIRGGGLNGSLNYWLATVSAWLDCDDQHDEESAAAVVELTALQRSTVMRLEERAGKILLNATENCRARFERWRINKEFPDWKRFVRSVGDLETILRAAIKAETTTRPDEEMGKSDDPPSGLSEGGNTLKYVPSTKGEYREFYEFMHKQNAPAACTAAECKRIWQLFLKHPKFEPTGIQFTANVVAQGYRRRWKKTGQ